MQQRFGRKLLQANRVPSSRSLPSQKSQGSDGLGPLDEDWLVIGLMIFCRSVGFGC